MTAGLDMKMVPVALLVLVFSFSVVEFLGTSVGDKTDAKSRSGILLISFLP